MLTYFKSIVLVILLLIVATSGTASKSSYNSCVSKSCNDEERNLDYSDWSDINSCVSSYSKCSNVLQDSYSAKKYWDCFDHCQYSYCTSSQCRNYMKCLKGCTNYFPAWAIAIIVIGCVAFAAAITFCIRRRYVNNKLRIGIQQQQNMIQNQNPNFNQNQMLQPQNQIQYTNQPPSFVQQKQLNGLINYQQQPIIYQQIPLASTNQQIGPVMGGQQQPVVYQPGPVVLGQHQQIYQQQPNNNQQIRFNEAVL